MKDLLARNNFTKQPPASWSPMAQSRCRHVQHCPWLRERNTSQTSRSNAALFEVALLRIGGDASWMRWLLLVFLVACRGAEYQAQLVAETKVGNETLPMGTIVTARKCWFWKGGACREIKQGFTTEDALVAFPATPVLKFVGKEGVTINQSAAALGSPVDTFAHASFGEKLGVLQEGKLVALIDPAVLSDKALTAEDYLKLAKRAMLARNLGDLKARVEAAYGVDPNEETVKALKAAHEPNDKRKLAELPAMLPPKERVWDQDNFAGVITDEKGEKGMVKVTFDSFATVEFSLGSERLQVRPARKEEKQVSAKSLSGRPWSAEELMARAEKWQGKLALAGYYRAFRLGEESAWKLLVEQMFTQKDFTPLALYLADPDKSVMAGLEMGPGPERVQTLRCESASKRFEYDKTSEYSIGDKKMKVPTGPCIEWPDDRKLCQVSDGQPQDQESASEMNKRIKRVAKAQKLADAEQELESRNLDRLLKKFTSPYYVRASMPPLIEKDEQGKSVAMRLFVYGAEVERHETGPCDFDYAINTDTATKAEIELPDEVKEEALDVWIEVERFDGREYGLVLAVSPEAFDSWLVERGKVRFQGTDVHANHKSPDVITDGDPAIEDALADKIGAVKVTIMAPEACDTYCDVGASSYLD